jgi:hypothetical protein
MTLTSFAPVRHGDAASISKGGGGVSRYCLVRLGGTAHQLQEIPNFRTEERQVTISLMGPQLLRPLGRPRASQKGLTPARSVGLASDGTSLASDGTSVASDGTSVASDFGRC